MPLRLRKSSLGFCPPVDKASLCLRMHKNANCPLMNKKSDRGYPSRSGTISLQILYRKSTRNFASTFVQSV